jgi:hypothetical protein
MKTPYLITMAGSNKDGENYESQVVIHGDDETFSEVSKARAEIYRKELNLVKVEVVYSKKLSQPENQQTTTPLEGEQNGKNNCKKEDIKKTSNKKTRVKKSSEKNR